jgi:hypothetical protein
LPYSIYNDIILKQINFKKKEKEEIAKLKSGNQKQGGKNQFRRRRH